MKKELNFRESVICNLNCMQEGLVSKAAAQEIIIRDAAETIVDILCELNPKTTPVNLLQNLYDNFGLVFVLHNGNVAEIKFDTELDHLVAC